MLLPSFLEKVFDGLKANTKPLGNLTHRHALPMQHKCSALVNQRGLASAPRPCTTLQITPRISHPAKK
jgi:hypothetical protein